MGKKINEIIKSEAVTASSGTSLLEALSVMKTKKISCLVVEDKRMPVGIITERDIARAAARGKSFANLTLKAVMTSPVLTAPYDVEVLEAYNKFMEHNIRHLVLVDSNWLLKGVITQTDVIKALVSEDLVDSKSVEEIMSRDVATADSRASVLEASEIMVRHSVSCVVIMDEAGTPVGIVTERDVMGMVSDRSNLRNLLIEEAMSSPVIVIGKEKSTLEAVNLMDDNKVRRLVVVDADSKVAGIVTQFDVVKGLEAGHI